MNGRESEFLDLMELKGRTWCIVEIKSSGGFRVPAGNNVFYYALLQGGCRIAGAGPTTIEMGPGDVWMVLSGKAHAVRTEPDSPVSSLPFLQEDHAVDTPPTFTIGSGRTTARLLCASLKAKWPGGLRVVSEPEAIKLDEEAASPAELRVRMLESFAAGGGATSLLTRMAALTLTISLRKHPQGPLLFQQAESDPIGYVLQLIESDPSADWSVASLARKVGMSRSTFAARFRAETRRTPMELVSEQRMRRAAEQLRDGQATIAEISARCGYTSEAAFSRRFTQFFGMRPGQMRKAAKQGKPLS